MKASISSKPVGFTLVEIMIVVAIVALLASIAIPNLVRARATSQANACINNLRQYDQAINQFAIEHGKSTLDAVSVDDIKPYIKLTSAGSLPPCPANGTYDVNNWRVGRTPRCSLQNQNPPHNLPTRYFGN
jgi:prepilin-type N-terminal cleavage/methylation domain-containing protein